MSIMTRLIRLWKADVHGAMDQMEDRELLMGQYLREMKSALDQKTARLQAMQTERQRLERDINTHGDAAASLEKDIDMAVEKEKDDIARFLIKKLKHRTAHLEQCRRRLTELTAEIERLSDTVSEQRRQYDGLAMRYEDLRREKPTEESPPAWGYWTEASASEEEIELELLRRKDAAKQERRSS